MNDEPRDEQQPGEPLPGTGNIIVTSEPSGADVCDAGGTIFGETPLRLENLPPGYYVLYLRKDGMRQAEVSGELAEGGTLELFAEIEAFQRASAPERKQPPAAAPLRKKAPPTEPTEDEAAARREADRDLKHPLWGMAAIVFIFIAFIVTLAEWDDINALLRPEPRPNVVVAAEHYERRPADVAKADDPASVGKGAESILPAQEQPATQEQKVAVEPLDPFAQAAFQNAVGRYESADGRVQVWFKPHGSTLEGRIVLNGLSYDAGAAPGAKGICGTYGAGEDKWPFTMECDGARMTLETGGVTTQLARRSLVIQPGIYKSGRVWLVIKCTLGKWTGLLRFDREQYPFTGELVADEFNASSNTFAFTLTDDGADGKYVFRKGSFVESLTAVTGEAMLDDPSLPASYADEDAVRIREERMENELREQDKQAVENAKSEELKRHWITCPRCGGSGCVTCPDCNGTGRARCSKCDGTGNQVECRLCHDTGYVKCHRCEAVASVNNRVRRLGRDPDCGVCGGTGKLPCPGHDYTCTECYGSGRVSCKKCRETGKLTCPQCKGEKKWHRTGPSDTDLTGNWSVAFSAQGAFLDSGVLLLGNFTAAIVQDGKTVSGRMMNDMPTALRGEFVGEFRDGTFVGVIRHVGPKSVELACTFKLSRDASSAAGELTICSETGEKNVSALTLKRL